MCPKKCHLVGITDWVAFYSSPIAVKLVKMEYFKFSSILALFLVLDAASALYFHIAEGERKCFIEEVPDDTTVIGKILSMAFFNHFLLNFLDIQ